MPILGRYGPFFLTGYFVVLALGALLSLGLTTVLAQRRVQPGWLDAALIGALAALAAGRVAFVALNPAYFTENPGEAWHVWAGGLNAQAALVAGLLAAALWLRLTRRLVGATLDLLAPGLALLAAAGWLACWFEGCAYGHEAAPGLLTAALPDDFGVVAVRYRTQLAGALMSLLLMAASVWGYARRTTDQQPGLLFTLTLAALALVHALVSIFRGDPAPLWIGLRADVVVDGVMMTIALFAAVVIWLRPPPDRSPA